jgi:hypothetical protein
MSWGAIIGGVASAVIGSAMSSGGGGGSSGSQATSNATAGQDRLANSQADASDFALDRLKNTYAPIEDQFNAAATEAGTPGSIAAKEGAATADVAQAYATQKKNLGSQLAARGINPSSGSATSQLADADLAQAADTAGAQTTARDNEINRGLQLKLSSIGIGRGDSTLASTAASNAGNAFAREGMLGAQQYQMGRQNNMDAGYGIAPIAKAASTAAQGIGNWFNNSSALSYAPGGSNSAGVTANGTWSQEAAAAPAADSDPGFYDNFKDGGVLPKGSAMAARGLKGYADGGVVDDAVSQNTDPGTQFLSQAETKYPFLKQHNMIVLMRPNEKAEDFAETYPAHDQEQDPNAPRPTEIPMDRHGVEIYKPNDFSVDDLAGEALHFDPQAQAVAKRFQDSLTDDQKERVQETGDFQQKNIDVAHQWKSGIDSVIRGYAVGQWPKDALDDFGFTPAQKADLDSLKQYMTSAPAAPAQAANDAQVAPATGVAANGARYAAGGILRDGYAGGGMIRGPGTSTSDSIPAKLDGNTDINVSNGEGIVNHEGVADVLGADGLNVINALGMFRRALNGAAAASRGISARG